MLSFNYLIINMLPITPPYRESYRLRGRISHCLVLAL